MFLSEKSVPLFFYTKIGKVGQSGEKRKNPSKKKVGQSGEKLSFSI